MKFLNRVYVTFIISFLFFNLNGQYWAGDVEGHVKIVGNIDVANASDSTSLFVGRIARSPYYGNNHKNTVVGVDAGFSGLIIPTSKTNYGKNNSLFGYQAGNGLVLGHGNTFMGTFSGFKNYDGDNNTFLGFEAGLNNAYGDKNTYVGTFAGQGDRFEITSNSNNTAIGYGAGRDAIGSGNVFLGYEAGKGASKQDNSLYINNTGGDHPLIYGDFDRNSVGINYNGTHIGDALFVEAAAGQHAMRVRVAGSTKLRVYSNGGVTIGANNTPPDNGLKVANLSGSSPAPLYVDGQGNLIRNNVTQWDMVPPLDFDIRNDEPTFYKVDLVRLYAVDNSQAIAELDIPQGATITSIKIWYKDTDVNTVRVFLSEREVGETTWLNFYNWESTGSSSERRIYENDGINHTVDNSSNQYYVRVSNLTNQSNFGWDAELYGVTVGYKYE